MRRFSMGLVLPAVVAAVALLLTGCGGSPAADPAPSATPSPSTTTPAVPTVPTLPQAAKQNTKAGALAFARHYIDLVNYAQATGDTKVLKAIEAPGCESCQSSRRYLDSIYSHGGRIVGGQTSIRGHAGVIANPETHGYEVDLIVQFNAQTVIRPKGREHLKGRTLPISLHVAMGTAGWKLHDWTRGA